MSDAKNRVHRLDEGTINKIAAGEVIERPASVVKELTENAIDAGATRIEIEIRNGGRQYIQVSDNGCGMEREDAVLAIERHTTSKIWEAEELWSLHTLGFRGEALPSVAAVSQFELVTKPAHRDIGTLVEVRAGIIKKVKDSGAPNGTTIKVQDLFFNTPARYKYLKSIPTEAGYISELIARLALCYPEISFRLRHHEYEMVFTSGNGDVEDAIVAIFGKDVFREMIPLDYGGETFAIKGYIGKPSIARTNRNQEIFFVNRRYFHNRTISSAIEKAFHTLLPIARYPFVILFLTVDPNSVDINAHPTKMEVRFSDESQLFKTIFHAVRGTLREQSLLTEWTAAPSPAPGAQGASGSQRPLSFGTPAGTPAAMAADPLLNLNLQMAKNSGGGSPETLSFQYPEFAEIKTPPAAAQSAAAEGGIGEPGMLRETALPVSFATPADDLASYSANPAAMAAAAPAGPGGERREQFANLYIFPKTVANTYIIMQDEKGLLFIDQHAAHERILYEKYLARHQEFLGTQNLLIPETMNLSYPQFKVVQERLSLFAGVGFEMEAFGGQTVVIRSVPIALANLDYRRILQEMIEQYINFETFKNPAEIKEAFLTTMACRTAVKAGDKLTVPEMQGLINDLFQCENSYTCPHGRPVSFRMGLDEIAKKFLRRPR